MTDKIQKATKVKCRRGRKPGEDTSLWEANGDVPLDGVAFSQVDWL